MIRCGAVYLSFTLLFTLTISPGVNAGAIEQPLFKQIDGEEVILSFRFQNLVNRYVTAWYVEDQGQFLLPHTELFDILEFEADINLTTQTVSGYHPDYGAYQIDYQQGIATIGGSERYMQADEYHIGELDFFIHPDLLAELFDLDFHIDFGQLDLRLETDRTIPVMERRERERRRDRALRTEREILRDYYPLEFDRERQVFNGAFLDYNLGTNISAQSSSYQAQLALGTELLGGDLQGSLFGNWSSESYTLRSSNLRWRYGIRDNPYVTRVSVGQSAARGIQPVAFSGVQVTNEPIEPRYLFDDYTFTGTTLPGAEVELYRNNLLIDYYEADEYGDYRFDIPLTYGTTRYSTRIYSPDGQMSERESRIQIPYSFAPPGELNYTVNAGRLDNPLPGTTDQGLVGQGSVSAGLTSWLTLSGAAEYFETYHEARPTFSTALTSRVFDSYLLTLEAAEGVHYRASGSVMYPGGTNINLEYRHFLTDGGIYNRSGSQGRFHGSVYTPFTVVGVPLFFRTSVQYDDRIGSPSTRYRFDLNSRLGRTNLRLSYRDSQFGRLAWTSTPGSRLTGALAYTASRSRSAPRLLRGLYLRGQVNWLPHQSLVDDVEAQISRRVFDYGRIQLGGGRNMRGNYNFFRFNLTFDFNRIRSNSTTRVSRGSYNVNQTIRGSVGYDSTNRHLSLSNRQQVGRSAMAVRLFMDHNNSGTFDEGDELLPESAVRIDRGGGIVHQNNGISYITQLQPYRRYNLTINRHAIRDPLLVPKLEEFSAVTDPNQFKTIDIPVYTSGVIEGHVMREINGMESPLAGARLRLRQVGSSAAGELYEDELRTFSDGSFYAYELPPGDYELEVEPSQLEFLDSYTEPEYLSFTIESVPGGDFVEDLRLVVRQRTSIVQMEATEIDVPDRIIWHTDDERPLEGIRSGKINSENCTFRLQEGSYSTARRAVEAARTASDLLDIELEVYFNPATQYYAVRSTSTFDNSDLQHLFMEFDGKLFGSDPAVVWQCSELQKASPPEPVQYLLQLGAFSSESNAIRFMDDLQSNTTVDLNLTVHSDETGQIHRVQSGPYSALGAYDLKDHLTGTDSVDDLLMMQYPDQPSPLLDFEFALQAGRSGSKDEIRDMSKKLVEEWGFESYLLLDGSRDFTLMIDHNFRRWQELLQTKQHLSDPGSNFRPVLHLIEFVSE